MTPEEVVDAQVAAYNARDIDAFLDCYVPDVAVRRFPSGTELSDRSGSAFADRYRSLFEASPDLHADIVNRIVHGRLVIDHEHVTGVRGANTIDAVVIYEVGPERIEAVWFLE